MIRPWLGADPEIPAEEGCAEFGDKLFHGISVITEAFSEHAVEAAGSAAPMDAFMQQDAVSGLGGSTGPEGGWWVKFVVCTYP